MGLEVAPFVQDLVTSNPISGDDVNQGDDHIRMMKATLKATFPTATRAMYAASIGGASANYSVLAADDNKTIYLDAAAAAFTVTLPVGMPAGFAVRFFKFDNSVNPVFFVVAGGAGLYSGSMSLTRARRGIPGHYFTAVWSGSAWFLERIPREPVGAVIASARGSCPPGYEYPIGQTLAGGATNYPEYCAMVHGGGVTPDMRGRAIFGKSNMGGADNGLISLVPGTTNWGTHGAQTVGIALANLPNVGLPASFTGGSCSGATGGADRGLGHQHSTTQYTPGGATGFYGADAFGGVIKNSGSNIGALTGGEASPDHLHGFSGSASGTVTVTLNGSGVALNKLPPLLVMDYILVVE